MKKRTGIKFEVELMEEIEALLEGTIFTTKTAFAADAIKEKVESVKKQQAEYNLKLLTDEFKDKQVQYRRAGINNIADLARTVILNTEDIKKLKQTAKNFDDLSMMMGGRFQLLPIIIESTKTGKKIRLATKEEVALTKLKKKRRSAKSS